MSSAQRDGEEGHDRDKPGLAQQGILTMIGRLVYELSVPVCSGSASGIDRVCMPRIWLP